MTAVVEDSRYEAKIGDLKIVCIVSSSACATGHTIDTGMDSAGGAFKTILNTLVQNTTGTDKTATWNNTTGLITLGSITTGVHKITIIGTC